MKKTLIFAWAVLLIAISFGCKRSVEGESSAWKTNKEKVNGLMSRYPGMKPALQSQLDAATKKWETAEGISDEDKKIAAMSEANGMISGGWIGDLEDYDEDKQKLQDLIVEVQSGDLDKNDREAARTAKEQAQYAIQNADRSLQTGAGNASGAQAVMRSITSNFTAATKTLNKVLDRADSKKKEAEEDEKLAEDKEKEKEAAKTWVCSYCDRTNSSDDLSCKGCGADKSAK